MGFAICQWTKKRDVRNVNGVIGALEDVHCKPTESAGDTMSNHPTAIFTVRFILKQFVWKDYGYSNTPTRQFDSVHISGADLSTGKVADTLIGQSNSSTVADI